MILKSCKPDTLKNWAKWAIFADLLKSNAEKAITGKTNPLAATYIGEPPVSATAISLTENGRKILQTVRAESFVVRAPKNQRFRALPWAVYPRCYTLPSSAANIWTATHRTT